VFDYHISSLRWEVPEIVEADSEEGKKIIAMAIDANKRDFLWAVKNMRAFLTVYSSDEDLYEAEFAETEIGRDGLSWLPFRYFASVISSNPYNPNAHLFDADGCAIYTESHLQIALDTSSEYKKGKAYVVSADVHY